MGPSNCQNMNVNSIAMVSPKKSNKNLEESQLRHPEERPLFVIYAVLNLLLLLAVLFIVIKGSNWLRGHPFLEEYRGRIRTVAIAAVFGIPAIVFLRNTRHALTRGKSIAVSPQQFPQIYAILQRHGQKLNIHPLPELYISDMKMRKPAHAYRSWKCDYIVLSSKFLQPNLEPMLPVFAFWLGREIGRLRLNHASWFTELLLAYVEKVPYLSNPLRHAFTYSEDRYGAFFAPEGLPGLIGIVAGRRMLPELNTADYLKQVKAYGGIWARLGRFMEEQPATSTRIEALLDAGLLKAEFDRREDSPENAA
jgi:hypothetical protein